MVYATGDDVMAVYGEDVVVLAADADDIASVEWEKFDVALENASAEIDAYVSDRYSLPIDPVPPPLKQAAIDIAIYRMCLNAPRRTEEHRKR
ncbi:phage protein Gp36 family protein [Microbaculum sp. FT89]|uniref:phage protein Gp36 family protein n=1 Tax=Microbaculum sp. FT89 TaxID=3447298 RepID=UPI003F53D601